MENQVLKFTASQNSDQRNVAIAASLLLILCCCIAIYMFLSIDPRRLVFRHQLIAFLILFDLLKAVILLIFPSRVITHGTAYFDRNFCQAVGFFTATAIEGADIAILAFAIHTFLLIFKPSLTVKLPNSNRVEGGLYLYRYYVYALSILIPLVLAALPYVGTGYEAFVCWCYLPQQPVWYRLVLSWVPRWCIMVIIFLVYGLIYYYVLKEFRTLGGVFTTIHKLRARGGAALTVSKLAQNPTFFSALRYFSEAVRDALLPKFVLPDDADIVLSRSLMHSPNVALSVLLLPQLPRLSRLPRLPQLRAADVEDDDNDIMAQSDIRIVEDGGPLDTENVIGDSDLQATNLLNFRKRQRVIKKQMKSIFIYPFAYIFVWLFPFILQCTQINYEQHHKPVFWLNVLGAFMQPFNGVVDSIVFFYREQPWKYTIMALFERDNLGRLHHYAVHNSASGSGGGSGELDSHRMLGKYAKGSFAALFHHDIKEFAWWRRVLSKLRLPLMRLPTEDNVARLSSVYVHRHLASVAPGNLEDSAKVSETPLDSTGPLNAHDFSNLLSGNFAETEFRLALEHFSLDFSGRRKLGGSHSMASSHGRRLSAVLGSNRLSYSRRLSTIEGRMPIPENEPYHPQSRRASVVPKRTSFQKSTSTNVTDDADMDIMEFLRKGPE